MRAVVAVDHTRFAMFIYMPACYYTTCSSPSSDPGVFCIGASTCPQVQCYEDNRLLKIFSDIVRLLYDADIVGEDTIMHW
jgi:hypothetical protein